MQQGTVALVLTPSLDPTWVMQLAALRAAGVAPIACIVDPLAHVAASQLGDGRGPPEASAQERSRLDLRSLLMRLAEHDVGSYVLRPGIPLGEQLLSARSGPTALSS